MRISSLILTLALGLVSISTNARAEELLLLDNLVVEQEETDFDLLESLVFTKPVQMPSIQKRLYTFFKLHRVQRPDYYARLITQHPMPEHKKKIMAAIIVPESRGKADAVSSKGAQGLLQVMPFWKKLLGIKGSLKDPAVNLDAASRVYDIHLKDAKGNQDKALYAYSGGSAWYPRKIKYLIAQI